MATLLELILKGELVRLSPELDADRVESRWFYLTPRLKDLFDNKLPGMGSTWRIEQSPIEQVDFLLSHFAEGEPLAYSTMFRHLRHHSGFVWELKTADVRIFGWFAKKDHFVGHSLEHKQTLVDVPGLVTGYASEVVRYVESLDLDEPKFIAGDDPSHVVSNFYIADPS